MDLLNLLNDFNSPSTSSSSSSTSSSPSYQLFLAASSGNLKRFHELTMKNKSSASFDILYNGYNTLHIATKKNHFSIVKYILEGGKVSNIDGGIEEVASEVVGREEVEKLLYSLTSDGENCLMIAAYEGRDEILKYLIEKFFYQEIIPTTATPTATATATSMVDKLGNNILHYAAWGGQLNCIKICLELCKINPLITNNEGMNSLQFASAGNHVDCLIYLENYLQRNLLIESLSQVKESNTISESGLTSFHRACLHGAVDIVRHLLQQIENENQSKYSSYLYKNTIMDLPIDLQDSHSLEEIRRMYFQQGVYYPTHSGNTALHLSTQNNSKDIVTLLLDHIKNETIKFPLFYVDEDIGKASSRSKKGIDIQNNYGLTPLHFSCIGGYTNIFTLLLSHGASLFVETSSKSLCLHLAATSGSHPICELICQEMSKVEALHRMSLIDGSARNSSILESQDQDGMTCIDMALSSGYKTLASKLAYWTYIDTRTLKLLGLHSSSIPTAPSNN